MTRRRKPQPKPQGKAKRKPAPKAPAPVPQAAEADPLADARIRPFVERYCDLAGVKVVDKGADLRELKLPLAERAHFQGRDSLRLALSLDALERSPDAEIAVLGSPFLTHLIEAIRTRAGRLSLGMIPPPVVADSEDVAPSMAPPVPVRDGTGRQTSVGLAAHPIGRLVARVVLRAGAAVEEAVVESDVFDLSTGTRLGDDVASLFQDLEAQRVAPADPDAIPDAALVPPREPDELLRLLIGNLREKSAERVAARQAAAAQEVAKELERLDRYFASILADKSDPDEARTITALHERRRTEEVRRHQVKAIVHPLQLRSRARIAVARRQRLSCAGTSTAPATRARCAAPSAPRTSAPNTALPGAEWMSSRPARSTRAFVSPAGWSTAQRTRGSAPRAITPPARRVSMPAEAAAGSSAIGTRSRAGRTRPRAAAGCARRACATARAGRTSRWAWTR